MNTSETITTIMPLLLKVQKSMESVVKGEVNPFFKSNYADINSVIDVCKTPLNDAGILVLQPVGHDELGDYVETILIHATSGEFITDKMRLVTTTDPQKQGSAITYARRYALQSLLFMQAVDDDGNGATTVSKGTTGANLPKYNDDDTITISENDTPVWKCPQCSATKTPKGIVFHKLGCPDQTGRKA